MFLKNFLKKIQDFEEHVVQYAEMYAFNSKLSNHLKNANDTYLMNKIEKENSKIIWINCKSFRYLSTI